MIINTRKRATDPMEKKKKFIINTFYYLILALFVYLGIRFAVPVVMPFIIAFVVAMLLRRPTRWFAIKLRLSEKLVAIFMVILFYLAFLLLILFSGNRIFSLIGGAVMKMPSIYIEDILPLLNNIFLRLDTVFDSMDESLLNQLEQSYFQMTQSVGQTLTDFSLKIVRVVSNYAAGLPSAVVRIIITIVATFFMAADYQKIISFFMGCLSEKNQKLVRQVRTHIIEVLGVFIKSYSLIIFITFTELCIGFLIMRIPHAVFVALGIAVFDILPVLGVGGILIPWAIVAALLGNYKMMIGIILLYLVVTAIRNTVEPRLVGNQIGLHPLATLISMFVGAYLFGLIGLFGFPVALSLLVNLQKSGVIRVFTPKDKGASS